MFIQKSDKATHQNSSWIAASLQFKFSRSQEDKQLQIVGSATYQADNKRNLQSVKAFLESLNSWAYFGLISFPKNRKQTAHGLSFWWQKFLSYRASSAKEMNNMAPDISYK